MSHPITIERDVPYGGAAHAIRMSSPEVELVIATDFGPRILSYARRGGTNVFGVVPPETQAKATDFGEPWHIRGGHRLWHAPEDPVLSYVPDNEPVPARVEGATVVVGGAVERGTSLTKELHVTLEEDGTRVRVEHRIGNAGREPRRLAVWALSVMAAGGTAIFPNAPFIPFPDALLPSSRVVLWPYSSLGDPRFTFGPRHLRLRHDPDAAAAQKIGLLDMHHGWAAYSCSAGLFVKRYPPARSGASHVDLGCNVEAFTDATILELETLGEEVELAPGAVAVHTEEWSLHPAVAPGEEEDRALSVALGASGWGTTPRK